jgi:hypothetical protein
MAFWGCNDQDFSCYSNKEQSGAILYFFSEQSLLFFKQSRPTFLGFEIVATVTNLWPLAD